MDLLERGYTTTMVEQLTGVSYRRLDWYVRLGVITPLRDARGSGTRRAWSADDVRRVQFLESLRSLGASTTLIQRAMGELSDDPALWPAVVYVGITGELSDEPFDGPCWRIPLGEHRQQLRVA